MQNLFATLADAREYLDAHPRAWPCVLAVTKGVSLLRVGRTLAMSRDDAALLYEAAFAKVDTMFPDKKAA